MLTLLPALSFSTRKVRTGLKKAKARIKKSHGENQKLKKGMIQGRAINIKDGKAVCQGLFHYIVKNLNWNWLNQEKQDYLI